MKKTTNKKLNVAVIGLGKMGLLHASILNIIPDVEVTALCDKNSLLLKFAKKLFKSAKMTKDIERLADLDIDTVFVTTPIPVHFPILKELCVNGVTQNFFVEKTLASNSEKANELCNLVSSHGQINMVGFMKRFAVTFQKAKRILDLDTLGELSTFKAHAYSSDFSGVEESLKMSASRGGVLRDLGSHVIDLSQWFFGDLTVKTASINSKDEASCKDSINFEVEKPGLEGKFSVSWCMDKYRMPDFGFNITGSKGFLNVNDDVVELRLNDGKSTKWYRHDLNDYAGYLLGAPEYYREDEAFIRSALTGNTAEPSFLTASKVDYIIDQVIEKAGNKS